MSNPRDDKDLTLPAAALARAAPREWAEFMIAFRKYTDGQRDHVVQATLEELQRAQGRAQNSTVLFSLLEDAVKAADRISVRAGK